MQIKYADMQDSDVYMQHKYADMQKVCNQLRIKQKKIKHRPNLTSNMQYATYLSCSLFILTCNLLISTCSLFIFTIDEVMLTSEKIMLTIIFLCQNATYIS